MEYSDNSEQLNADEEYELQLFLKLLEEDMNQHPETITPICTKEMDEIARLVDGVEIDD